MKLYKSIVLFAAIAMSVSSCVNDLDVVPLDDKVVTSATVFNDEDAYLAALAKIYAGLAITGQQGPTGNSDLNVNDEGFTSYLRLFWNAQELPTDEAVNSWGDSGLPDFHTQSWSSSNNFTRYLYDRIFYQVAISNEYVRQVSGRVSSLSDSMQTEVNYFLAEARFMRALSYYHAMDLYANVPFVTEDDPVGSFLPDQITRSELFDYIESELIDIVDDTKKIHLKDAKTNLYARADKGAAWALLARLYLNASVYKGQSDPQYYTDCITYCKKVIDAGYSIHDSYAELFMADNNQCTDEIIFPIAFDGLHTQSWGGMTFIISAAIGGNMNPADFGSNQKWGGNRTTSAVVNLYDDNDGRAMFHTDGQKLEIKDIKLFTDGYAVKKFTNKKSDGTDGQHQIYSDTDFPLFRLADVYLMYAEAVARGGAGGSLSTAKDYINELRERVGADAISESDITATTDGIPFKFIMDERARELLWECQRRTDLVRFGQFSNGTYMWPWKGGVEAGVSTPSYLNVYPIPASDRAANPKLDQNDGY